MQTSAITRGNVLKPKERIEAELSPTGFRLVYSSLNMNPGGITPRLFVPIDCWEISHAREIVSPFQGSIPSSAFAVAR